GRNHRLAGAPATTPSPPPAANASARRSPPSTASPWPSPAFSDGRELLRRVAPSSPPVPPARRRRPRDGRGIPPSPGPLGPGVPGGTIQIRQPRLLQGRDSDIDPAWLDRSGAPGSA